MCFATDSVLTICLHTDFPFNIVLCDDRVCKSRVTILRLIPGWCTECREALSVKFVDEKSLRKNATPLRAWASLAQIGKVEMIKPMLPMLPTMISSAHLEKVDSKLTAQAEELWERQLLARIGGFKDHNVVRVGNKQLSAIGDDQAKLRAVTEMALALTKTWVDEAKPSEWGDGGVILGE